MRRFAAAALGMLSLNAVSAPVVAQDPATLSFVIRDWYTAMHESKFMDECPEGLNVGNEAYWWYELPRKERAEITENGFKSHASRYIMEMARGPNQEDVCMNPTSIFDPPLRVVEGRFGYGENLDGTEDGHATAKTCAHKKFVSPDGKTGIDNQMYRLVGCTFGWRKSGMVELNANESRGTSGLGMILIEITGVKDPRNSDDVTVSFYRSIDQYTLDSNGRPLPFSTYRIDTLDGKALYGDSLKGRIKDGVLTTARGDVTIPYYGTNNFMRPVIKDMGLRLEIAADGATASGMITGYYDMERFLYSVGSTGQVIQTAQFSCPAMYVAAHKLADGYPDPKTGECTMLSGAFKITAYSAFVLHPERDKRQAAR